MALGKSHDMINMLLMPIPLYFIPKEFYLPFTLGYIIGTFFLSPDLDLRHSKPSKRWGYLKVVWLPYQKKSKHRGISHIPILGTIIRLFYLNFLIFILYFVIVGMLSQINLDKAILSFDFVGFLEKLASSPASLYFLLGLFLSEVFHVLLDVVSTLRRVL
ncbi:metal-binding protein [Hydrogenobacter hydrogenophilus]|uniref:Uncharacterized metal-binding protein n=1 Tax=Hydrogenobacter hydrogenophilus TaxID=35835 RepID=A0A285NW24_9AQUI|nr:DUF2227 family putative metal-binding protein [Hydrogenobacter hydrogenophilus]SNZ13665.1 Uncharacterized metal-binding protein [Hydrogenobacter hydrogenophilus]